MACDTYDPLAQYWSIYSKINWMKWKDLYPVASWFYETLQVVDYFCIVTKCLLTGFFMTSLDTSFDMSPKPQFTDLKNTHSQRQVKIEVCFEITIDDHKWLACTETHDVV